MIMSRTSVVLVVTLSAMMSLAVHWISGEHDVCPYRERLSDDDSDDANAKSHEATGSLRLNAELEEMEGEGTQPKQATVDLVVVAGAWRRPNGTLSRAFRHRVVHGLRVAMLFGAKDVLFTGGLNDSFVALEYAQNIHRASTVLFPSPWVLALEPHAQSIAQHLKGQLAQFDHLPLSAALERLTLLASAEDAVDFGPVRWPAFHVENMSLTTYGNAVETRKWIDDNLDEGARACDAHLNVVVVSSQYHNRRCHMLFTKVLHQRDAPAAVHSSNKRDRGMAQCGRRDQPHRYVHVFTSGAIGSMFEVLMPDEWITFAAAPSPTMERVPYVPRWFKVMCKTTYLTYRNWRTHLDVTLFSVDSYAMLREMGAFGKAVVLGLITPKELLFHVLGL